MSQRALSLQERAKLEALYQKSWDTALMHDVTYLVNLNPSFFGRLINSSDPVVQYMGQYAILLQWYLIDWWNEDYSADWRIVSSFTAVLLYLVNPWDLIPDAVPDGGWTDDLYVLQLALSDFDGDLDEYVESMNIDTAYFDAIWE